METQEILLDCLVENWQLICLSLLCVDQHLSSSTQEMSLAEPLHPVQLL